MQPQSNNETPYSPAPMAPNPYAEFMASPTPPPQRKGSPLFIILFIVSLVVLLIFVGLFAWAFSSRQDYKNNVDKKVAEGVAARAKVIAAEEEKKYQEREKNPYKTYQGPATYGTINIVYPKTWSGFVSDDGRGGELVDGYFHPNYVPGVDSGTDFALRVQIVDTPYAEEVKQFDSQVKKGVLKVSPYRAPKMGDVSGTRVDGEIEKGQRDSMVLFPLRDKTIKVSTESQDFLADFENIVLANLVFIP